MHAVPWASARTALSFLALAALLLAPLPAEAVSIDYEVLQGAEPQFQWSFLHAATSNCCGAPPQYNNNGTKLFRIDGTLTADWDAVAERAELLADVSLDATVIHASVPSASVGDVFTLVLKAGSFLEEAPNGRAEGELVYELYDPDDLVIPVSAGTFHVFAEPSFPDSANRVSELRFNVWANNWDSGTDPVPAGDFFSALGIDMVTVPSPAASVLVASGIALLGLGGLRRRA